MNPTILRPLSCLLFIQVLLTLSGWSQNYDFDQGFVRYSIEDGLSENTIRSVVPDHLGFYWIATKFGLNRFDGHEFVNFTQFSTGDSLPANQINSLLHDSLNQRMWICTPRGLVYYDLSENTTPQGRWHSVDKENSYAQILQINQDEFVVLRNGGLEMAALTFSLKDNKWEPILWNDTRITSITMHPNQHRTLWGISPTHVKSFDLIDKKLKLDVEIPLTKNLMRGSERLFWDVPRNELILSHSDIKPMEVDTLSGAMRPYVKTDLVDDLFVSSYCHLEGDRYLLGSANKGLMDLNLGSGEVKIFKRKKNDTRSLSNDKIYFIEKDKAGGIWVCTDDGLNYYDPNAFLFNNATVELKPFRSDPIIHTAVKDGQTLIVSGSFAEGGKSYDITSKQAQQFDFTNKEGSANANYSYYEKSPSGDEYWMNINRVLKRTQGLHFEEAFSFEEDTPGESSQFIHSMTFHDDGSLLVLTYDNIIWRKKDGQTTKVIKLDFPGVIAHGFGGFQFMEGKLWILSSSDFGHLNVDTGKWHSKLELISGLENFTLQRFSHFSTSSDGEMLIIANGNSLVRFNPERNSVVLFARKALEPYNIYDAVGDKHGNCYVYTNQGLLRCAVDGSIRLFNALDGLPYHMSIHLDCRRDEQGYIFVTSDYNVTWFHEDSLSTIQPDQHIYLNSFRTKDLNYGSGASYSQLPIEISAYDNSFSFAVTSPYFNRAGATQFMYRLKGLEDDWRSMGNGRNGSYAQLPGGSYELQVKGHNSSGKEIAHTLSMPIEVASPFYKSHWFKAIVALLLAALLYSLFKMRMSQVRAKANLESDFEKKLAEVEMSALRAQMNPHFLFNCLNSIKFFIIKNEPEQAADYLTKFSRLIRLILNNSKSELVNLHDELEALGLYIEMEKLRFEKAFSWTMNVDPSINTDFIEIPPLLLQPFVENAIWHGLLHKDDPGQLTVDVIKKDQLIEVIIKDDGVGRKRAAELKSKSSTKRKSLGMQITKDRITAINTIYKTNADVTIEDLIDSQGNGLGTLVKVSVPI